MSMLFYVVCVQVNIKYPTLAVHHIGFLLCAFIFAYGGTSTTTTTLTSTSARQQRRLVPSTPRICMQIIHTHKKTPTEFLHSPRVSYKRLYATRRKHHLSAMGKKASGASACTHNHHQLNEQSFTQLLILYPNVRERRWRTLLPDINAMPMQEKRIYIDTMMHGRESDAKEYNDDACETTSNIGAPRGPTRDGERQWKPHQFNVHRVGGVKGGVVWARGEVTAANHPEDWSLYGILYLRYTVVP